MPATTGRNAANPILTPRAAAIESLPAIARVDVRDVMSLLGVSKSTITRWIAEHRLPPPLKDGQQLRWPAGVIRAWLNGEEVTA